MDDLASAFLGTVVESALREGDDRDDELHHEPGADPAQKARSLRRGLIKAASLQDMLLEKLLHQMIPVEDGSDGNPHIQVPDGADDVAAAFAERPGFTVTAMSNNFRRFNARIGVVFQFQAKALRVLSWRRPSHTLSLLAVYTFICLDPYLLCALPLALALFGILVPSFVARHPAPVAEPDRVRNLGYSPRGPPLAPARTVKPVKELSRDFFRNMGDLQNVMEDFSVAHDKIIALVVPKTNFSDEALSSAIFVLLSAGCALMTIAAHLLPWRFLALAAGWAGICSGHPAVGRLLTQTKTQYLSTGTDTDKALTTAEDAFNSWVRSDIILDEAPETREVEIFELQRLVGGDSPTTTSTTTTSTTTSGEWEAWLFSPSPYDPLSAPRIAGQRPRGTRFFEDVLPPEGWQWSEKKWALDLWSREWVEERIITGVEVETEGERWVYDIYNEHEREARDGGLAAGELNGTPVRGGHRPGANVSWEEGEEGVGRRGEWRRRRWVRMVKRRNVTATG
ncbi:integral peroxisomal membrane peroxin-domain-containing protein [Lasiosphaeris hirsuta]|uniref:Integral peroxisomal membrane peroxin-domain-containing protein n=1 Tax=Lasiosphaeris hirsuta TaxID=260670 RepID=A0AA40API3_9PEZI|nr:integral peroxisomal membrane peroxin-domain-containing protein [Lasiosphaeris hirsuta]